MEGPSCLWRIRNGAFAPSGLIPLTSRSSHHDRLSAFFPQVRSFETGKTGSVSARCLDSRVESLKCHRVSETLVVTPQLMSAQVPRVHRRPALPADETEAEGGG
eukprot:280143-Rhodomonas_salina.1